MPSADSRCRNATFFTMVTGNGPYVMNLVTAGHTMFFAYESATDVPAPAAALAPLTSTKPSPAAPPRERLRDM